MRWNLHRSLSLLIVLVTELLARTPALAQYSSDERYLAKLRAGRLFELADDVCRARLSTSSLTPRERATFTIERMLVQTEKGVNAPLAERPAAFEAARAIAKDFALNHAANPRADLVRFQDALTVLTIGELQRLEAELGTASTADIEAAKGTLREAVTLLEALDAHLQKKMPDAARNAKGDDAISAEEIASLRSHVGFQLARAARNQALLYPEKGEDRTASLLRGKRQLEESVLALNEAEPLHWLASIELVTFERMLGDTARAAKLLEELESKSPPSLAIAPLRAEQIRLLVATKRAANAAMEGAKWAEAMSPRDADVDLALLEAIVAENSIATTSKSLMEMLGDIETKHGPYWGRRASALVLKNAPPEMATGNLELLTRTADQLYLQNNWEAAISAYDRAAQKAKEEKKDAQFVDLANRAALVEQERKGYGEAVRRFLELAAAPEAKAIADVAYLCAAWNQKQLLEATPKDAQLFVKFKQILKDLIAKHPDSPHASTGRLWLALAYEARGEFETAFKTAELIPNDAKEKEEGRLLGLRYWNRLAATFDHEKWDKLSAPLDWAKANEGDQSSPAQRKLRLAAISWELLNRADVQHSEAESRLRDLIAKAPASEAELVSSAQLLLIVALAAQPTKHEEAAKLLAETAGSARQRLSSLMGLVKVAKNAGHQVRPALGNFILLAIEKLKPELSKLTPDEKILVDLAYADGVAAQGDEQKAHAILKKLSQTYPNSANVQETYAAALFEAASRGGLRSTQPGLAGTPGSSITKVAWAEPLAQWRLVASRSKPRSERWYRAKYYVAKTQAQMGQTADAAKLIDLLDATPPGLKGAPMEEEFRALRKVCQAESKR